MSWMIWPKVLIWQTDLSKSHLKISWAFTSLNSKFNPGSSFEGDLLPLSISDSFSKLLSLFALYFWTSFLRVIISLSIFVCRIICKFR